LKHALQAEMEKKAAPKAKAPAKKEKKVPAKAKVGVSCTASILNHSQVLTVMILCNLIKCMFRLTKLIL
jgi:hypothetical protein